jgi:hypothetical protein
MKKSLNSDEPRSAHARKVRYVMLIERFLMLIGIVLFLAGPYYRIRWDGQVRFHALQGLIENGQPEAMKYSYVGPVVAAPFYVLGSWIDRIQGGALWAVGSNQRDEVKFPVRMGSYWWGSEESACHCAAFQLTARYNAFLWLVGIAAMARMMRGVLPPQGGGKFFLLLLAGSLAVNHSRDFYGEIFTVVLVGVGITSAYLKGNNRWSWFLLPVGVANTPGTILGLGFVTLRRVWESRQLRYALLPVAALLIYLAESRWRMGVVHRTGYEGDHGLQTMLPYSGLPGFSYPMFFGILGLTLSFGKGIAFYAPGILLPAPRRLSGDEQSGLRSVYLQWMLFLIGLVLFYSKWWAWFGGLTFGPRFLVFASLPAALALSLYLAVPSRKVLVNACVLAILALSLWVGVCGALFDQEFLIGVAFANGYRMEHLVWHVPEFSALWHPFLEHHRLIWPDFLVIGYAVVLFVFLGWECLLEALRGTGRACSAFMRGMGSLSSWRF